MSVVFWYFEHEVGDTKRLHTDIVVRGVQKTTKRTLNDAEAKKVRECLYRIGHAGRAEVHLYLYSARSDNVEHISRG